MEPVNPYESPTTSPERPQPSQPTPALWLRTACFIAGVSMGILFSGLLFPEVKSSQHRPEREFVVTTIAMVSGLALIAATILATVFDRRGTAWILAIFALLIFAATCFAIMCQCLVDGIEPFLVVVAIYFGVIGALFWRLQRQLRPVDRKAIDTAAR